MKLSPEKIGNLLSDESFLLWLSGEATETEKEKWEHWLDECTENKQLYTTAHALWKNTQFLASSVPDTEEACQALLCQLDSATPAPLSSPVPQSTRVSELYPSRHRKTWRQWGYALAAAVVLIIFLWQYAVIQKGREFVTLNTQYGEQQQINLPDGSKIILNAQSSFRYPKHWDSKTKRHFFLKGEAYFEVTTQPDGAQKEFVVSTSDGLVKVLGTVFVVYDRGQGTRVAVEKGRVEVYSRAANRTDEYLAKTLLTPGHLVRFHRGDQTLHPDSGPISAYLSWWKDSFRLNKTPFREIVQRLEETYGITIEVQDRRALDRVLSGSIENHDLEVILKTLSNILQLPVYRQGNKVIFAAK